MPEKDSGPKFTSGPPKSGREPARARGPVTPPDAEDVIASTEPDDDLSDYVIQVEPEPEPEATDVADPAPPATAAPQAVSAAPQAAPAAPQATTVTTADTELVLRLERELVRARARLEGKNADVSAWPVPAAPAAPKDGETVLIHIREDGFTANGRVWYRGQEIEFTVGAQNWNDTCGSGGGSSWLLMTESEQLRSYGKIMFGHGPWPGSSWENDKAATAEDRRGRTAPTITQIQNLASDRL